MNINSTASSLKLYWWKIILGVLVTGSLALKLVVLVTILSEGNNSRSPVPSWKLATLGSQCNRTVDEHDSLRKNRTSEMGIFVEGKLPAQESCVPPQSFLHANVILDRATASFLLISLDQKTVRNPKPIYSNSHACVRGQEGFTSGNHWWEVEVMAGQDWSLGLVRESSRNLIPDGNCMPWLIGNCLGPDCPYPLISTPEFNIKVFLDYAKGLVFFQINNNLLITVLTTTFSQEKIYPMFCLGGGTQLKLSSSGQHINWLNTIYFIQTENLRNIIPVINQWA